METNRSQYYVHVMVRESLYTQVLIWVNTISKPYLYQGDFT